MTEEQLKTFARRISHFLVERTAPLSKRLAEIERRVDELDKKSMGVDDGLSGVRAAVKDLDATLRRPVVPLFGKDGMLTGVARVDARGDVPGAPETKANAQIVALEGRLNWIETTLDEKKRDEKGVERCLSVLEDRMRKAESKA